MQSLWDTFQCTTGVHLNGFLCWGIHGKCIFLISSDLRCESGKLQYISDYSIGNEILSNITVYKDVHCNIIDKQKYLQSSMLW